MPRAWLIAVLLGAACPAADVPDGRAESAAALRIVRHQVEGKEQTSSGRVLVTAADGGLLLETRDGQLVTIKPDALISSESSGQSFSACDEDELSALLLQELGEGFQIVRTKRYVIATNASPAYGQWCGRLLERLQVAFLGYWRRAGIEVSEPEQPLVAIIFAEREQFGAYAMADAGPAVAQSQGYYSIRSNRIVLSDLTNIPGQPAASNESEVRRRLESRAANLSTIVHEATHQIAFNCGLHTRYADNPMWLLEGMAMFCEAPDLKGTTGWRTIGRLHPGRVDQVRDYVDKRRKAESLASLVVSEDRFRDPATAVDAYAESWALTYFLIREHREQYVSYLQQLAGRPRLVWDNPEQREQAFLTTFETDWETLGREFLQFVQRLRAN